MPSGFARLLIGVSFIISYPIAKILDCCLGHQAYNFYSRFQLKELVDMHHISVGNNDEVSAQSPGEPLTQGVFLSFLVDRQTEWEKRTALKNRTAPPSPTPGGLYPIHDSEAKA